MRVCVQGLWHLGSVTAACTAAAGHEVVGFDRDREVVAGLSNAQPPISEPGLRELVASGLATGRLSFASSAAQALAGAEILWVTYDTPVDADDAADIEFVVGEVSHSLAFAPDGILVLVSSQLPVGSIKRLEHTAAQLCPEKRLRFASSPENLRLGKALDVFNDPDRIVVGVRTEADRILIAKLLEAITSRVEWMSVESAEMTKHAINAFLATSVTFANEIAAICERTGADAKEVERGLKTESRIGPKAYLSPGAAFAGGTLARDIRFLTQIGEQEGVPTQLLASVKKSNDEHKLWAGRKLLMLFPSLEDLPIAVLGLTYKPGTDTLRRSLSVELCDWLLERGARLRVHDPVVKTLPAQWAGKVEQSTSAESCIEGVSAVVLATEWPQYRDLRLPGGRRGDEIAVLDPNGFLTQLAGQSGVRHFAVGSPNKGGRNGIR